MARLSSTTGTSFIILDDGELYDESEIDRICERHAIADADQKMALWRLLEECGRALIDQKRLQTRRTQIARLRQDLQMGLRLTGQLAGLVPDAAQLRDDTPTMTLTRRHLAALREAERRLDAGRDGSVRTRLEDAAPALECLQRVFEMALEACGEREDESGPDDAWRAAVTAFYSRTLSRPWSRQGDNAGERFLADCRIALERATEDGEGAERVSPVRLASQTAG
ncbi:hypothetical protein GCM10007420_25030 [Glycocaulis albus]|jgi:hypothetical protein|uniref:Uncharacterized protein n=1 Tax=Glycocaulis albus TaxID=1382801 RepID=A0ABQ1XZS1_9PROT|nr:hypothetical protein [Glycocaulis albus]MBV5258050.1 hypothetical protein [Synechococcus moorigangaii CMS01]GGH07347.1 hypothetical protein GCM10007420_25030 [Glycocaulis albus]